MHVYFLFKDLSVKKSNTLRAYPSKSLEPFSRVLLQPVLFNNRDFGLPSRQHKKDWVFLMAVQAYFPKELDFLSIPRPDCLPRNAHSFYNP